MARFAARFAGRRIVALHSGLTPAQRLRSWLAAHLGHADLVLGTRLAVFASLPRLGLIVVDEEHDPSYKQQEGARYSARDLAVWRGQREGVRGRCSARRRRRSRAGSAPRAAATARLALPERVGGAALAAVRLVDMGRLPRPTRAARVAAGARAGAAARRGAARARRARRAEPALPEPARLCAGAAVRRVRLDERLPALQRLARLPQAATGRCAATTAAWRERVPRACPDCGNPDIAPVGRGTERLEEQLARAAAGGAHRPHRRRQHAPQGRARGAARRRARRRGRHPGRHADGRQGPRLPPHQPGRRRQPGHRALRSDFRAPGAAVRAADAGGRPRRARRRRSGGASEMWIQTWHPTHPLYQALGRHDYAAFAAAQLEERESAGLPPFSHLALLRAEAKTADAARDFLARRRRGAAAARRERRGDDLRAGAGDVARVADVERMQMLVESASRPAPAGDAARLAAAARRPARVAQRRRAAHPALGRRRRPADDLAAGARAGRPRRRGAAARRARGRRATASRGRGPRRRRRDRRRRLGLDHRAQGGIVLDVVGVEVAVQRGRAARAGLPRRPPGPAPGRPRRRWRSRRPRGRRRACTDTSPSPPAASSSNTQGSNQRLAPIAAASSAWRRRTSACSGAASKAGRQRTAVDVGDEAAASAPPAAASAGPARRRGSRRPCRGRAARAAAGRRRAGPAASPSSRSSSGRTGAPGGAAVAAGAARAGAGDAVGKAWRDSVRPVQASVRGHGAKRVGARRPQPRKARIVACSTASVGSAAMPLARAMAFVAGQLDEARPRDRARPGRAPRTAGL